jgi:hypothetical protein
MTNSIWKIAGLECKPTVDGLTDYVVAAHWTLTAVDGEFTGSVYGSASFKVDPANPEYIPFENLTEEKVIEWTKEALGEEEVIANEENVIKQIESQKNPSVVNRALPWS